jgi:hypothetical protein
MKPMTRKEALRRSVVPLVAVTGAGGLTAAVTQAASNDTPSADVALGTVTDASSSSLTVARDDARASLLLPIEQAGGQGAPPWSGNPFRIGDRDVLDLDAQGTVVAVEPLSDHTTGVIDSHLGERVSVNGVSYMVDPWSLARITDDTARSGVRVVPLSRVTLERGTTISVLARRTRGRGTRRIVAVFPSEHARAGVGA